MGKHEKGTPKEIANRCKSKGLQKLRWFCEMCKKQCRDQNGFKCHLTSETHQRQLLLFAENSNSYLKEYSNELETNFLKVLRSTFGTKRVRANEVYQEYIRDKMHTHMNSTIWHTLTNFVLHLGKSGKCRIDHTEKGWFIAWIDQEEELRKHEAMHKIKAMCDDEERQQLLLEQQVERAREKQRATSCDVPTKPTEIQRSEHDGKINFSLAQKKAIKEELTKPSTSMLGMVDSVFNSKVKKNVKIEGETREFKINTPFKKQDESRKNASEGVKRSALDEIREMEERRKEKRNRKDHWLHEGIVVKIVTKKYGNENYKAKGVIKRLVDDFHGQIEVAGSCIEINQADVETVIPAFGKQMLIVNGAYRGAKAVLESLDEDKFCVTLRIKEGFASGRVVSVPYEDASKLS